MGKTGWNKQSWATSEQDYGNAGGWSYWQGAWKSAQQNNKGGKGNPNSAGPPSKNKDAQFPAYDQMGKNAMKDKAMEAPEHDTKDQMPEAQGGEFLRQMQKLLNASRKLDGRLRKAKVDKDTMSAQWQAFQEELRASFIEQRQKFLQDSRKAEVEMAELALQKQDLLTQIQQLVLTRESASSSKPQQLEPTQDDIAAWNDLMMPTPQRSRDTWDDDEILQQALQAAQNPEFFLNKTLAELAADPGPTEAMDVDHGAATSDNNGPMPVSSQTLVTPPRRKIGILPATPQRPAVSVGGAVPNPVGGGGGRAESEDFYHYKLATHAGRDPYMASPNVVGDVGTTSPVQELPTFGPIRKSKARDLARQAARSPTQDATSVGPGPVLPAATIINDDDEPTTAMEGQDSLTFLE